jgi:hypothetical protein
VQDVLIHTSNILPLNPSSSSSSKSLAARFLAFLLCEVKMSPFVFEGRERPVVVREEVDVVSREESVEVKAREVEEEISLV